MKVKLGTVVMMALMVVALAACQGERATVTGGYGASVISGEVTVTGVSNTNPAGVQVSVRGTGMSTTLSADGRFTFVDAPEGAQLDFFRAEDGINASLGVMKNEGFLNVELSANGAKKSSKRRASGKTTEKIYEFEGTIVAAAADSITVYTSHKEEILIGLSQETVIRKGMTILTPADLLVNQRVHVKARKVNDAFQAASVILQNEDDGSDDDEAPAVKEYEGTVRSAAADSLVVYTSKKVEVTFVITADTIVRKGNAPVAITDLKTGDRVHVKAITDGTSNTNTAMLVIVQNTSSNKPEKATKVRGTVTAVGADSLTVATSSGPMTVKVDASTKIEKNDATITLADVAVGDSVKAEGTKIDATTILAKKVEVEDHEDD